MVTRLLTLSQVEKLPLIGCAKPWPLSSLKEPIISQGAYQEMTFKKSL